MKQFAWQGRQISKIALGSTNFGEPMSIRESWRVMDYAREQGINFFDTARIYGYWYQEGGRNGYCEKMIGDYMRSRGCRNEIYLVTKGAHPPFEDRSASRLTPACLREDLEGSLQDLGTDHIDLYFLHRDHPDMDLPAVMETLHDFVKEGKVLSLGASNWHYSRILEANAYAKKHGLTPFCASQVEWSMAKLADGTAGDKTQVVLTPEEYEAYRKSGMLLMAYTSQAHGLFSKAQAAGGYEALAAAGKLGKYKDPANAHRIEAALTLCQRYGISPAALAVSYITSQTFPAVPILGCSRKEQMEDSLSAVDLVLSPEDYALLLQEDRI